MKRAFHMTFACCEWIFAGIAVLITAILSIFSFSVQSYVALNISEQVILQKNSYFFWICLAGSIMVLLLGRKILRKVSERNLFQMGMILYLAAAVYLIFNVDGTIRADAGAVFNSALSFNQGDYSELREGGYLFIYPHQLGLVTFERLLMFVSENTQFFFWVNFAMILGINYFQWKIAKLLFPDHELIVKYTIFFSYAFVPQFFFTLFVYGEVPGLFFLAGGFLWILKYLKSRSAGYMILGIGFIGISCLLRNNFMIGAIAMLIILILDFFQNNKKAVLLWGILLILAVVLPGKILTGYYEQVSGSDLKGAPKLLWAVMGLQDTTGENRGGWYNGYNMEVYIENNYDPIKSQKQAKEDLKERLEYFAENPGYTWSFFETKIKTTWCDPLFQSVWSGPLEDLGQFTYKPLLQKIYNGQKEYGILASAADILLFLIYVMSFLYILLKKFIKREVLPYTQWFPVLFIIGGFLFHLIWETKSQYVYPFVFLIIPLSAAGFVWIGDWAESLYYRRKLRRRKNEK